MTIEELKKQIHEGEVSCVKVVEDYLKRIKEAESGEKKINAVITLNEEGALKQAEVVDEKIKNKEKLGLLEGIPIAVKDVLCTKDLRTTAASKILDNFVPTYDATVVKLLKEEGAVIVAKTNCDEFAHGSSGENSAYGPTCNPFDLERVAGGSSSGSGAIVAYDGALAALGTDTGGSLRAPGSFMGLIGLKTTYGRVSRNGLIAMCSSTDTVGCLSKNVSDAALMLTAISNKDPKDSTSGGMRGKDFSIDFPKGLKGMRFAYPKEMLQEGLDKDVEKIFFENVEKLKSAGASVEEISIKTFGEPAVAAYYVVAPSEISSNLCRFDGIKYGQVVEEAGDLKEMYLKTRTKYLGPEAKRRIMLGTFSLSAGYYDAYYNHAQKIRRLMKEELKDIFKKYDIILTPTMVTPAFKIGSKADPLAMYLADIYSIYANLTGICALSVNGGWVDNKEVKDQITKDHKGQLPVGIQMMAEWWDEETLLRAAYCLEQLEE